MIRTDAFVISAAILIASALPLAAQQAAGDERPGIVAVDAATAQARVAAVDHAARTVTLRGEEGHDVTLTVGPEVKNFDQVEKGDLVTIEFNQATEIFARAPEQPAASSGTSTSPGAERTGVVARAPRGEKPAAIAVDSIEIVASVEDIDYGARTVTLKGPRGNVRTVKVGDEVKNLDRVKKGDEVVIRHTQAVRIAVTK